jgi:hypothetical protein
MTEVVFDREANAVPVELLKPLSSLYLGEKNYSVAERMNVGLVQVFMTALSDVLFNIWTIVKASVEDT